MSMSRRAFSGFSSQISVCRSEMRRYFIASLGAKLAAGSMLHQNGCYWNKDLLQPRPYELQAVI
jgi:hypothetical protein